ncbi:MAG: DegT/DnrJ/EryC1/StrS family aminotransferase [Thalassovita sp.]
MFEFPAKLPVPKAPCVPVMQADLPLSSAILPYLEQMDQNRVYSNFGPLSQQLETRLAAHFGMQSGGVLSASSGSAALVGAILALTGQAAPGRQTALCASYSFAASVSSLRACGYIPQFVDVDSDSWALDPQVLRALPDLAQVGLVVVTAPYGRAPDIAAWESFTQDTGIPVVIDAAAGFDVFTEARLGFSDHVPVALSFHATKAFACGEGGAILSTSADFLTHCRRAINHGFWGVRRVTCDNTNGKMSEYHASVALAELDRWESKAIRFSAVADCYRSTGAEIGIGDQLWLSGDISGVYALCQFESGDRALWAQKALYDHGFDSRFWYGFGLHAEPAFAGFDRGSMTVTNTLSRGLLGLPTSQCLSPDAIAQICKVIASI